MSDTERIYDPQTGVTVEAPKREDRAVRPAREMGGEDVDVVPDWDQGRYYGIYDRSQPTPKEMRKHNVSVFAQMLQLRAERLAGAITGLMPGQSGFGVIRNERAEQVPVEDGHPWRLLIQRPNPGWSVFRFWRWMSLVKDLQGHADAVIERDSAGRPRHLWPLYPSWGRVTKRLDERGAVDVYLYRKTDQADPVRIQPQNMVRLEHPDPVAGGETASLLERGVYELSSEIDSKTYERDFLQDGRPPNVYIKLEGDGGLKVSDRDKDQEESERMQQGYMGTRANKVPILRNGEFASVGIDPDQLQMLESREMRKDDLFTITGIPPALFAKDPTNANVEAAERIFATGTLQPLAIDTAAALTQQLERAFGAEPGRLQVQAPNMVPTDEKEQSIIHQRQTRNGHKTLNDIRRENGDEEYDTDLADQPLVPKGVVPLSMAGMQAGQGPDAEPGERAALLDDDPDADAWDLM